MEQDRNNDTQPADGSPIPEGIQLSPREKLDALRAEVEELDRERNQFKEMLQRVQADFINHKRRIEEEREGQQRNANSRLILKLLPVLDEFSLAIDHASKSEAEPTWLEGIKLIQRKLDALLDSENVGRIDVEGREFDPLEHEALAYQESSDHQDGEILTVVREGYKLHDRIIRPALVILAKRPEPFEPSISSTEKEPDDA